MKYSFRTAFYNEHWLPPIFSLSRFNLWTYRCIWRQSCKERIKGEKEVVLMLPGLLLLSRCIMMAPVACWSLGQVLLDSSSGQMLITWTRLHTGCSSAAGDNTFRCIWGQLQLEIELISMLMLQPKQLYSQRTLLESAERWVRAQSGAQSASPQMSSFYSSGFDSGQWMNQQWMWWSRSRQ